MSVWVSMFFFCCCLKPNVYIKSEVSTLRQRYIYGRDAINPAWQEKQYWVQKLISETWTGRHIPGGGSRVGEGADAADRIKRDSRCSEREQQCYFVCHRRTDPSVGSWPRCSPLDTGSNLYRHFARIARLHHRWTWQKSKTQSRHYIQCRQRVSGKRAQEQFQRNFPLWRL